MVDAGRQRDDECGVRMDRRPCLYRQSVRVERVGDNEWHPPPYKVFGHDIRSTIRLDSKGRVGMFKLENWVERTTNDVVNLHGPKDTDND